MKTLRQYIQEAENVRKAIGHFNAANSDMVQAIFQAARKVSQEAGEQIPVVVGFSEGERDALGVTQAAEMIESLRNEYDYPIFSNADHTYSVERTKEAIDAGFDMVIYDGMKVSEEENIVNTKEVVQYRNETDSPALVESELGFIGAGSNIKDKVPEGVSEATMTDPEEAKTFVEATNIDLLSPSVGNVHGMIKSGNPSLNPERIEQVRTTGGVPLVLHGGSGSSDEDFRKAIDAGISMIHISTEMRVAYFDALKESINATDQLAPYKYMKSAKEAVQKIVEDRIRLFWRLDV